MLEEALGVEKVMRMAIDAVIMTIETIRVPLEAIFIRNPSFI